MNQRLVRTHVRGTPGGVPATRTPGRRPLHKQLCRARGGATLCVLLCMLTPFQTCLCEEELPKLARRPSPMGAMVRSTLVPGWGQWYVGRKTKAAVLSAAAAGFVWQGIEAHKQGREKDRQRLTVWASLLWLYAIVDAYVGAHLSRFDEEMKHASEEGRVPEGVPEQAKEEHDPRQNHQD